MPRRSSPKPRVVSNSALRTRDLCVNGTVRCWSLPSLQLAWHIVLIVFSSTSTQCADPLPTSAFGRTMLYRSLLIACLFAFSSAFMAPAMKTKVQMSKISMGGKGFGGGEATRDPEPTNIDPNDPKGKQGAIHKAESFSDYLARRGGAATSISAPAAAAPAAAAAPPAAPPAAPLAHQIEVHTGAGKGFGGGEATRNPEATALDPNDPKAKQGAIHKAESFAEYLARRPA